MAKQTPEVGDAVIFYDEKAVPHDALVTVVHGDTCVNLLHVSSDPAKQDQYGRQIERRGSVVRGTSMATAYGYYFRYADEPVVPISQPAAR